MTNSRDDAIFLLDDEDKITRISRSDYRDEDALQKLIERCPEILAGDQLNVETPLRWLLVKREAPIPDSEEGADRWSLDHLLVDQFGMPTLIEVKRSKDPRSRRRVVGQMLDYAANAHLFWDAERLRAFAAETHGGEEQLEELISDLVGNSTLDADGFWEEVSNNLSIGRLRLLFVADRLRPELKRIIEFLNERMRNVDVLGVELPQFEGDGLRAVVPRVIGQTTTADKKISRRKTTERTFLESVDDAWAPFFRNVIRNAKERDLVLYWGVKGFSVRVPISGGKLASILYCYPPGASSNPKPRIQAYVGHLPEDIGEPIRDLFLEIPAVTASGRLTATLDLVEAKREAAEEMVETLWRVAENLRAGENLRAKG